MLARLFSCLPSSNRHSFHVFCWSSCWQEFVRWLLSCTYISLTVSRRCALIWECLLLFSIGSWRLLSINCYTLALNKQQHSFSTCAESKRHSLLRDSITLVTIMHGPKLAATVLAFLAGNAVAGITEPVTVKGNGMSETEAWQSWSWLIHEIPYSLLCWRQESEKISSEAPIASWHTHSFTSVVSTISRGDLLSLLTHLLLTLACVTFHISSNWELTRFVFVRLFDSVLLWKCSH